MTLRFARPVLAVREVNGAEEPADVAGTGGFLPLISSPPPVLREGAVELSFGAFRPRTLAVQARSRGRAPRAPRLRRARLPYDLDGISGDDARKDGDFDGEGRSLPGELLPATLVSAGIPFRTGPRGRGEKNVLVPRGQKLALPPGDFDRVYLVAAAVGGDRVAPFAVDGVVATLTVPDWAEPVGQWNSRLVGGERVEEPARIAPAYAKATPVAWVGTHRHGARGENEAYALAHLFRLRIDLPKGARELALPSDPHLRILSATAARNPNDARRLCAAAPRARQRDRRPLRDAGRAVRRDDAGRPDVADTGRDDPLHARRQRADGRLGRLRPGRSPSRGRRR